MEAIHFHVAFTASASASASVSLDIQFLITLTLFFSIFLKVFRANYLRFESYYHLQATIKPSHRQGPKNVEILR